MAWWLICILPISATVVAGFAIRASSDPALVWRNGRRFSDKQWANTMQYEDGGKVEASHEPQQMVLML